MTGPGTLYVVATPLGNLEDITLRALAVLRGVGLIACEDTRQTRKLLDRHAMTSRLVACHRFNEAQVSGKILAELAAGQDVALVSDGGTPAISDPGSILVARAIEAGIKVVPLPGPNAAVAALSASGLPASEFTFRGFLPHRRGDRRRALASLAMDNPTQVFFESPLRLVESLTDMGEILGPRRCAVVREMTKKFEDWRRGSIPEVLRSFEAQTPKGEICILVEGASSAALNAARAPREDAGGMDSPAGEPTGLAQPAAGPGAAGAGAAGSRREAPSPAVLLEGYRAFVAGGSDRRDAIKRLARRTGLPRSEVYRRLMEEERRLDILTEQADRAPVGGDDSDTDPAPEDGEEE